MTIDKTRPARFAAIRPRWKKRLEMKATAKVGAEPEDFEIIKKCMGCVCATVCSVRC